MQNVRQNRNVRFLSKYYLEITLKEYQKDGDEKAFLTSLAIIAKAKGGFIKLAKETGLNREHLYRALSEQGDPKFSIVIDIVHAFLFVLYISQIYI